MSLLVYLVSTFSDLSTILRDGGESPGDDVRTYSTDSGDA